MKAGSSTIELLRYKRRPAPTETRQRHGPDQPTRTAHLVEKLFLDNLCPSRKECLSSANTSINYLGRPAHVRCAHSQRAVSCHLLYRPEPLTCGAGHEVFNLSSHHHRHPPHYVCMTRESIRHVLCAHVTHHPLLQLHSSGRDLSCTSNLVSTRESTHTGLARPGCCHGDDVSIPCRARSPSLWLCHLA